MKLLVFQLSRFLGIGFLNTAVDFAVLNFLMFSSDMFKGVAVGGFAAISFTAALLHSFFWNKYWAFRSDVLAGFFKNIGESAAAVVLGVVVLSAVVFGARQKYEFGFYFLMLLVLLLGEWGFWKIFKLRKIASKSPGRAQFTSFVVVSIIGALINAGILTFGTQTFPPRFGFDQELWTNLIKAFATGISLIWNFAGYKLVVFRR